MGLSVFWGKAGLDADSGTVGVLPAKWSFDGVSEIHEHEFDSMTFWWASG